MATIELPFPKTSKPGKLVKWRVNKGTMVSAGRILLLYKCLESENGDPAEKKLRATQFGRVTQLHVKEGDTLQPGQVFLSLVGCKHPTVMKDLCAACGADLRQEAEKNEGRTEPLTEASVSMLHSIPELKVCPELAEKIGKEDEQRLLEDKKLALLVDLDQTIVHTTNDIVPANIKDVFHYQLYGPLSPWYHTRLRPGTRHFLTEMSRLYELHICTFGARNYAHKVASLLDEGGALFSHRILSRDECFDPALKTANLKALFPCGDDMACIIDDREDVWQGCRNLVQVKPYHFFRHTGDIHAPPGLGKNEDFDFPETSTIDSERQEEDSMANVMEATLEQTQKSETPENGIKEVSCPLETEQSGKEDIEVAEKEVETSKTDNRVKNIGAEVEKTEESLDEKREDEMPRSAKEKADRTKGTEEETASVKREEEKVEDEMPDERKETKDDEDHDDYLLYLEDILRRIHAEFYESNEEGKGKRSLREIIPRVRARVLKGLCLTFSGLIPTNQKLHQSRAYKVAVAFGAKVTQDLTEETTHLVAIKPGTAKANTAKKNKNIKLVNPDWLWLSAERWERVDERLFPLTTKARASRIPPAHCSSPDRLEEAAESETIDSFVDSINPLMSFSAEEIENMDKEVEEDMSDQEMDYTNPKLVQKRNHEESSDSETSDCEASPVKKRRKRSDESSTSDESFDENDKYIYKRFHREDDGDEDEDEDPVTKFRRGEDLPDDLDLGENSQQDSIGDAPEDDPDDREWNALGAALEREFLTE